MKLLKHLIVWIPELHRILHIDPWGWSFWDSWLSFYVQWRIILLIIFFFLDKRRLLLFGCQHDMQDIGDLFQGKLYFLHFFDFLYYCLISLFKLSELESFIIFSKLILWTVNLAYQSKTPILDYVEFGDILGSLIRFVIWSKPLHIVIFNEG
jgi:hypothetical protein